MGSTQRIESEPKVEIDYFGEDPAEQIDEENSPYAEWNKLVDGGMSRIYLSSSNTVLKVSEISSVVGSRVERYSPLQPLEVKYLGHKLVGVDNSDILSLSRDSLIGLQHTYTEALILQEMAGTPHLVEYKNHHFASIKNNLCSVIEMEYVEKGKDLFLLLELHKKIPYSDIGKIIMDTADTLIALGEHGIVHNDIKLDNLIYSKGEHPGYGSTTVIDLGLSHKLPDYRFSIPVPWDIDRLLQENYTYPGCFKGTAGYATPEQVRGEKSTRQSDVFQLGIVAFRMFTREPVFPKDCQDEHGKLDLGSLAAVGRYNQQDRDNLLQKLMKQQVPSSCIEAMAIALDPDPAKRMIYPLREEARAIAEKGYESLPN